MKVPPKYRPLKGSERATPRDSKLIGLAEPNETLTVTLLVRRRPGRPQPRLEDYSRKSGAKRKNLSRAEFARVHGSTAEDFARVVGFARGQSLEVLEAYPARGSVQVRGTVAQLNSAFAIELRNYDSPTRKYRSYEGAVHLPPDLIETIEAIVGLDTRPVPARHFAADPPNTNSLTPQQAAALYDFPDGSGCGQTIGIYEMVTLESDPGFTANDLSQTMAAFGGGAVAPVPIVVPVDGFSNSGVPDPETVLDITVSSAVAPGAAIAVYFTGDTTQNIIDALLKMIHPQRDEPVPTVISISYGWSPDDDTISITPTEYDYIDRLFQEAAILGITVLVSSGDFGAKYLDPVQAQTSFPASDPWVLACGGTTIGNVNGSDFDEYVWNDSFGGLSGATGGGVSARWPVPAYQAAAGIPVRNIKHTTGRGVPDIAGNASPNSGYPEFLGGVSFGPIGGTSAVAPLYAGLIARINGLLGVSVGFINPLLYASANTLCRDVVGAPGPANNSFGGVNGYSAGAGWDACTGLGSVRGKALLLALLETETENEVLDSSNPFKFANWNISLDEGANDNGDDVSFGNYNHGDAGDPQGRVFPTVVENCAPTAAAFIARNIFTGDGTVGVFETSSGATRSIGVAGESGCGCGVYGLGAFGTSIGVVGRSMGAAAVEDLPLERVVNESVGVLGHSTSGAGVRGHGGPLQAIAQGSELAASLVAAPGGVFSSGQLQDIEVAETMTRHRVSVSALPQLRLVPSTNSKLPVDGRVGDLYVNVTGDMTDPGGTLTVTMYLCVLPGEGFPGQPAMWAPFTLGRSQQGG